MTTGAPGRTAACGSRPSADVSGMHRRVILLQLVLGWLPVGVLYAALIGFSHPGASIHFAAFAGFLSIAIAAALGLPVQRLAESGPWRPPFRPWFGGLHVTAAVFYAVAWQGLTRTIQWGLHGNAVFSFHYRLVPSLILGVWLYVMVAGVAYATQATERVAKAEASGARAQLAALRGQPPPPFL